MTHIKSFCKYLILGLLTIGFSNVSFSQSAEDCLMCHDDKDLRATIDGKKVSAYVNAKIYSGSVHGDFDCVDCHIDIEADDIPHGGNPLKVDCATCHEEVGEMYIECYHGKAYKKGDRLAPYCTDCHGYHNILPVDDPRSSLAPMRIPYLCGSCHKEGSPVQTQRNIPKDKILEHYSQSIHGEGLLKKGLTVSATCVSCHSAHRILPHTDSRSTIARGNIAETCAKCHVNIEDVHQKVIKGELWEKEAHVLPACVDCHQPHEVRKSFYDRDFANQQCLKCHENPAIVATDNGRSLFVDPAILNNSQHRTLTCSQCHVITQSFDERPCEHFEEQVDCASCHAEVGMDYTRSIHGRLSAQGEENAPECKECHGTHDVMGKYNPESPIFSINIPTLCATCHREGEKAAVRIHGVEHDIVSHYTESIHGKGLLESGLTVTATCTDCHTAHRELPPADIESSVNPKNIATTCGNCHHGIVNQFDKSVHSPLANPTDKTQPVCSTCHSAHEIRRADSEGFKLTIMDQCGNCHKEIAETYFDTYHGKVSQLGYTKTAKCYDCHGAHNILPVENPASKLSRENVVETCQKCHPNANRQFAGYFTHATHHDPDKYPLLFWTFWGMTGLLVGTFVLAGIHTLLWLPKSLQWRRKLEKLHKENEKNNSDEINDEDKD